VATSKGSESLPETSTNNIITNTVIELREPLLETVK
jgi:hypothetical protein